MGRKSAASLQGVILADRRAEYFFLDFLGFGTSFFGGLFIFFFPSVCFLRAFGDDWESAWFL